MSINRGGKDAKLDAMTEKKLDRRVRRTRALLNDALIQLIREKGYDNVTIEEITERANLGRSTFYLHYQSKDDLLIEHHDDLVAHLRLVRLSRNELLGDEPQPEMVELLEQLSQAKAIYEAFARARDASFIMREVQEREMQNLTESLQQAFPEKVPTMPVEMLTRYIISAQFSLLDWWMMTRNAYSPVDLATMLHQMRLTLVKDAYQLDDSTTAS